MPVYTYKCKVHGLVDVRHPMSLAGVFGSHQICERCEAETPWVDGQRTFTPMTRVFNPQGFIMRPTGYNLGPQDKGYFTGLWRERELGELRSAPAQTDTTVDTTEWPGISTEEMNRLIPEQAHQDLSEWCQANVPT